MERGRSKMMISVACTCVVGGEKISHPPKNLLSPGFENLGTNLGYHFKMYTVMYCETVPNNLGTAKKGNGQKF